MADQWLPESEAKVSMYCASVMQAAAAFEMTRSFNGKTFKLDEHLDRLENSCRLLGIPLALSKSALHAVCDEIVDRNRDAFDPTDEHRLLIVASPGCAPMYRELEGVIAEPYVYVTDFPLRYTVAGMGKYFTEGVQCVTTPVRQVPDECVPSQSKHRSRLHFHGAAQWAAPAWALMKDQNGNYCEAPGANIVLVRNGHICFLKEHALPGISMQTVMELAQGQDQPNSRQPLLPPSGDDWLLWWRDKHHQNFDAVDEMWLTGTPFCMIPVVAVDGVPIGQGMPHAGKPGPIYNYILKRWSAMVGVNIAEQIQRWDAEREMGQR